MARTVTFIPARTDLISGSAGTSIVKRRVAGYARVSTDKDEQFTSYEAQVDYYTQFIKRHPEWEFVKVYTDEGISGLNTKKRDGFNKMIKDALNGKINLIITKSVSRFARNTVDSLTTIRKLKENGVEVFFEKENIWTFDGKGELLLTIMSSLAQEESRSISENVTWGHRKRFSDGKFMLPYKQFLGYDRGESKDDPPVVNTEQAQLVRRIYTLFISGKAPGSIAKILTDEGISTPAGKTKWYSSTIRSILSNEKYRGSARLQKHYTVDFLTKKQKLNEGEVPQYYIEQSHEAIISPEEWDAVQDEIERRKKFGKGYSGNNVLNMKIYCGDCGGLYGPKTWHSVDKYKTIVWQCNSKFDKDKPKCTTPHLTESEIKKRFLSVYNTLLTEREPTIKACREIKQLVADTSSIVQEMERVHQEMEIIKKLTEEWILSNSTAALGQKEYNARYNDYVERYKKEKARYEALDEERKTRELKGRSIDRFLQDISERDELITEFDNCLWLTVVERVTVRADGMLEFRFINGMEMEG